MTQCKAQSYVSCIVITPHNISNGYHSAFWTMWNFKPSIALKSRCQVKKKYEIQTSDKLKGNGKVAKILNNVSGQTKQVQPCNVLNSVCQVEIEKDNLYCAQSNHITYPSISERPITAHKIQNLSKEKYWYGKN